MADSTSPTSFRELHDSIKNALAWLGPLAALEERLSGIADLEAELEDAPDRLGAEVRELSLKVDNLHEQRERLEVNNEEYRASVAAQRAADEQSYEALKGERQAVIDGLDAEIAAKRSEINTLSVRLGEGKEEVRTKLKAFEDEQRQAISGRIQSLKDKAARLANLEEQIGEAASVMASEEEAPNG